MTKMPALTPAEFALRAADASAFLKAMSHAGRLMVLCCLREKEMSVSELQAEIGLSQSALSQHLAILRDQHLVSTRRSGQQVFYRIHERGVLDIIDVLVTHFCPETLETS